MGEMRQSGGVEDITTRIQLYGVLSKRPFGHQSNKWAKRFFIIRDGFLLYYPDNEKKDFEKKRFVNIHPKGAIPLGGCQVDTKAEPGHPFAIQIKSDEINGNVTVAAESEYDRDRWVISLRQSCRVTLQNVQLGDTLIQHLETEGLKMAQEKQDYFDQLQTEASALHDEKQKNEQLERVREELEAEKQRMEQLAVDLKDEHNKLKCELEETSQAMKAIDDDKYKLNSDTKLLQEQLESLAKEKEKILGELTERQSETLKLSQEKESLKGASETLRHELRDIEEKTLLLLQEKSETAQRLQEKEERAMQLEEEKLAIKEHADELQESIKDLSTQKAATEANLKEEIVARLEAEKRLKEAESSLARLEKAVEGKQGEVDHRDENEVREEMLLDVRTLKRFFENIAFDQKIEADKTYMIKSALNARKSCVRRAQTLRYQHNKKRKSRGSEESPDTSLLGPTYFTQSAMDIRHQVSPPRVGQQFRHSSVDLVHNVMSLPLTEEYV